MMIRLSLTTFPLLLACAIGAATTGCSGSNGDSKSPNDADKGSSETDASNGMVDDSGSADDDSGPANGDAGDTDTADDSSTTGDADAGDSENGDTEDSGASAADAGTCPAGPPRNAQPCEPERLECEYAGSPCGEVARCVNGKWMREFTCP